MIHQLLTAIVTQLRAGLTGQLGNPNTQVVLGPIIPPNAPQRPSIAPSIGDLVYSQTVFDDMSSQPRSVELRESINVNAGSPGGPYILAQTPLEDTVALKVVFDPGLVTEYSITLLPGVDFTVNLGTKALSITKDITGGDVLRVVYSFVGVNFVREFNQDFFIEVYENTWTGTDRWLALCAAIVGTQQELLLEQFNFTTPTSFPANGYQSQVMLQKIRLMEVASIPPIAGQALTDVRIRMIWQATGQIRMSRTLSGGFGILSSIHTQGLSGPGVKIQPDIG